MDIQIKTLLCGNIISNSLATENDFIKNVM